MHFNRQKFSGASKHQFLGSKVLKSSFMKKKGLECSFCQIEVLVVTKIANQHKKHKMLAMLLRADFLRIFKILLISRFLKIISSKC